MYVCMPVCGVSVCMGKGRTGREGEVGKLNLNILVPGSLCIA